MSSSEEPAISAEDHSPAAAEPLPPWVTVGADFYAHDGWRIESVVGKWIEVVEKRSGSGDPSRAWIYLPTGVVYGDTTLMRRSEHGLPVATR